MAERTGTANAARACR